MKPVLELDVHSHPELLDVERRRLPVDPDLLADPARLLGREGVSCGHAAHSFRHVSNVCSSPGRRTRAGAWRRRRVSFRAPLGRLEVGQNLGRVDVHLLLRRQPVLVLGLNRVDGDLARAEAKRVQQLVLAEVAVVLRDEGEFSYREGSRIPLARRALREADGDIDHSAKQDEPEDHHEGHPGPVPSVHPMHGNTSF